MTPKPAASERALPQGALVAYKDPLTNGFTDKPPAGAAAPLAAAAALNRSPAAATLVEVQSPGGGKMVLLRGSFQSFMTAALGSDGRVRADCASAGQGQGP